MGNLKPVAAFSGFSVKNKAEAENFYKDVLGLDVSSDWMGIQITIPNSSQKVFVYEKSDHLPAEFTIFNLVVENIDTAIDELVGAGVVFEKYDNLPAEQDEKGVLRGLSAGMGPDIAWFKDPSGNTFGLLQEK